MFFGLASSSFMTEADHSPFKFLKKKAETFSPRRIRPFFLPLCFVFISVAFVTFFFRFPVCFRPPTGLILCLNFLALSPPNCQYIAFLPFRLLSALSTEPFRCCHARMRDCLWRFTFHTIFLDSRYARPARLFSFFLSNALDSLHRI